MKKALIICSGGLDSSTMALIKKKQGYKVDLISFNYGQKAIKEIQTAENLALKLIGTYKEIDISSLSWIFGKNQLTDSATNIENDYKGSVVVPLRNAVFVQVSYIYAMVNGYDELVLGSHLDDITLDEKGEYMFPDCSPQFFMSFNETMKKGIRNENKQTLITSASIEGYWKNDLIQKCFELDSEVLFNSWSCYKNEEKQCGECDSCRNRKNAFNKSGIIDKTIYTK
jgi:7-cyano-7-deazaguanine synthase